MPGFPCPTCAYKTHVTDSRPFESGIKRTRKCPNSHTFYTYEFTVQQRVPNKQSILKETSNIINAVEKLKLQIMKVK